MRFFILVQLIFAEAKIKKSVSRSAERDSGLCPENPQPFEKGWRKLYFACGRDGVFPHTYKKTIPIIAIQIHMGIE